MSDKIPVSVIITTLNEEKNLPRCLAALERFDEVIVVDSGSRDSSRSIAESYGASFIDFSWNGQYPKKRQWCLDTLTLKHAFVFFVDADEEVTSALADEIAGLDWNAAGYFVDGLYVVDGTVLKRGMRNRKLCLIDRKMMEFPLVDDLDIPGMGEMEGHYQPRIKTNASLKSLRRLKSALLHYAFDDTQKWQDRHHGYAIWEREMARKSAYPADPVAYRQLLKSCFRRLPGKGFAYFIYYFIVRGGFLEGKKNLALTARKMQYYDQ